MTRLSYANVMATFAVFISLGGSSYAVAQIGSRQIKDNSIRSADVRDGSLLAQDFRGGRLPAGPAGPQGPKGDAGHAGLQAPKGDPGPAGPQGATGAQGPPGISGLEVVQAMSDYDSIAKKGARANCPPGKAVIGTAASIEGGESGLFDVRQTDVVITAVLASPETTVPGSVTAGAVEEEPSAVNWSVVATAICAHVT